VVQDITNYGIIKLKYMEIMSTYEAEIRKGITASSEQQNNQNGKTSGFMFFFLHSVM
jgi:hypothetical protein